MYVTITGPPDRVVTAERVFGTARIPVKSFAPHSGLLPGIGPAEVYDVDVGRLDAGQRERLVAYVTERFGLTVEDAESELDSAGFPILAAHTIVAIDTRFLL